MGSLVIVAGRVALNVQREGGRFMHDEKVIATPEEQQAVQKKREFPRTASHDKYDKPEPILDASCIMEQADRGEGMGVDDVKTYHRMEK